MVAKSYFESHPTVVLGIFAVVAAVVAMPVAAVAAMSLRLFGRHPYAPIPG
jgi:hypothetical protein